MVEFGKTLNDVVKSDWRCHAVAYMELKRALSESHNDATTDENNDNGGPCAGVEVDVDAKCGINGVNGCVNPAAANTNDEKNNEDDAHSVHTESSYCISDNQKANFFCVYEDSVRRLTNFYENKVQWAREEREKYEIAMKKRISDDAKAKGDLSNTEGTQIQSGANANASNESSSSSSSFLIHQITNYSRDLGLALEFLELNATAFSKIMKKFDKRTGSNLRESKLKELKAQHPYLYDGGELRRCKNMAVDWIKQLQLMLQQDEKMVVGHMRGHFSAPSSIKRPNRRVSLTLQNSLRKGDGKEIAKLIIGKGSGDDDVEDSENPQESSEMPKKTHSSNKDSGAKKTASKEPSSVRFEEEKKNHSATRSIHKTRDFQILQNMIDRVNEELCLQKADSPFFDRALSQNNPPPSFMSSEVELAKELGVGEFCKIYEVSKFNVPESCHICFLHRGYNDPAPWNQAPKKRNKHRKIPSTVDLPGVSTEDEDGESKSKLPDAAAANTEQPSSTQVIQTTAAPQPSPKAGNTNTIQTSTFSFDLDGNISDYDELKSDHEEDDDYEQNTRGFMKDHCLRDGEARYAIKRIRSSLVGEEEITDAAIDLAREAEFLAALKHPNIIRIRGTINVPGHPKYSIILDRLYDTLEVQMKKWKVDLKRYQGKFKGLIGKNKIMLNKMWMDRLVATYDLARAMAYLHSRGVLHRDIKPANIGFDIRGDIKIFDFGLAKELKPSEREGQDQYHTSGLAGTRRYMAPEVAQVMPYGLSADVYSFGILMWEILTLKGAFETYTREKHYKEVVVEGKRPKVTKSWPFVIKNLVQRCWHKTPRERPTFQSVCELIKFSLPQEDTVDVSGRSNDLLLRSIRSTQGRPGEGVQSNAPSDSSDRSAHDHLEEDAPSDSLSQSIRIKSERLNERKHYGHNAVSAGAIVEE